MRAAAWFIAAALSILATEIATAHFKARLRNDDRLQQCEVELHQAQAEIRFIFQPMPREPVDAGVIFIHPESGYRQPYGLP